MSLKSHFRASETFPSLGTESSLGTDPVPRLGGALCDDTLDRRGEGSDVRLRRYTEYSVVTSEGSDDPAHTMI